MPFYCPAAQLLQGLAFIRNDLFPGTPPPLPLSPDAFRALHRYSSTSHFIILETLQRVLQLELSRCSSNLINWAS